ncbi:MAG: septal ring lytic transglycosylase RlpA family protein [Acidobacteriota bacterium]
MKTRALGIPLLLALTLLSACLGPGRRQAPGRVLDRGIASWYGPGFAGNLTANGERFDPEAMTAAHKTLPFDTVVEVVNLDNGKRVQVRINDRGPFIRGRVIDLSKAAARKIDMIGPGTARVEVYLHERPESHHFTVQVGAFKSQDRARALLREVKAFFPLAKIRRDGSWHRVQIGVFDDRCDAETLHQRLVRHGYRPLIVQMP